MSEVESKFSRVAFDNDIATNKMLRCYVRGSRRHEPLMFKVLLSLEPVESVSTGSLNKTDVLVLGDVQVGSTLGMRVGFNFRKEFLSFSSILSKFALRCVQ